MFPESWLSSSIRGDRVVPAFLGPQDHPWLRVVLEEHERFAGRPQHELWARLREPLPCIAPAAKLRLAVHVLGGLLKSEQRTAVPPRAARRAVFGAAARTRAAPAAVMATVAAELGVAPAELGRALFADLPGERLLAAPPGDLSPTELGLRANLVLAQAYLHRAAAVTIEAEGNARVLCRHAKLRGLICAVAPRGGTGDARLTLSGPFALFRHTLLYGRALGELLPLCAWCRRFRLHAECVIAGRTARLELASGDPIFPAAEPRRYDSRIEERFAREFRRLAPAWDLVREPEPVSAGGALIFPDFALTHRAQPERRWLLEIAGFWTPGYITRKLALLRRARLTNLILCIDEERNCAATELPPGARVLRYRRRVDPAAVLRAVGEAPG